MKRLVSLACLCCTCAFLFLLTARAARAIPVFANGQGVSCEECHTTFPGMTPYGMMVMMTNFQILNRHLQNQALPFAVRAYVTSYLANKDRPGSLMVSDLSLLGGGFIGRNFTWYLEQHAIDSGQIGQTEQMWLSWNGLFHGTNSLQLGKFHTPFPFMPAHAPGMENASPQGNSQSLEGVDVFTYEKACGVGGEYAGAPADVRTAFTLGGGVYGTSIWSIDGKQWPNTPKIRVRRGDRVAVTFTNKTDMDHPMHLHGHVFRIVAIGGKAMLRPLAKDVSLVPANGGTLSWTFDATSPAGRWLLHCHNEVHMMDGMMTEVDYLS